MDDEYTEQHTDVERLQPKDATDFIKPETNPNCQNSGADDKDDTQKPRDILHPRGQEQTRVRVLLGWSWKDVHKKILKLVTSIRRNLGLLWTKQV